MPFEEIIAWGKQYEKNKCKLIFESEASYKHSHVLRAPGETAGNEVLRALKAKVHACKNITVKEFEFCADLLTKMGELRALR